MLSRLYLSIRYDHLNTYMQWYAELSGIHCPGLFAKHADRFKLNWLDCRLGNIKSGFRVSGLALPGWIYSIYSSFNLVGKNCLIKTAQSSKRLVRISRPVPRECATQNYVLASLTPLLISTCKFVAYDLFLDDNFMNQSLATTSPK